MSDREQFQLDRRSPALWYVSFDNPPLNIFGPKALPQMNAVVTALETDPDVRVVVFDSGVAGAGTPASSVAATMAGTMPGPAKMVKTDGAWQARRITQSGVLEPSPRGPSASEATSATVRAAEWRCMSHGASPLARIGQCVGFGVSWHDGTVSAGR